LEHALVIGGAGFIGSHLVEELIKRGHEVSVLDNLSLGSRENLRGLDCEILIGGVHTSAGLREAVKKSE